jgi:hypothetical protein
MKSPLLLIFDVLCLILFGFIAWKPEVWVSLTPFRPTTDEKLARIYRWTAIATICGTALNQLFFLR